MVSATLVLGPPMQELMAITIWAPMYGSGWIFLMNEVKARVAAHGGTEYNKCGLIIRQQSFATWRLSISGLGALGMSNDADFIIISLR